MEHSARIAISLQNVGVEDGEIHLESLTLAVPEGSCFALLGLPGSGKTTVVKALAGLARLRAGIGYIMNHPLQSQAVTNTPRIGILHQATRWPGRLTVSEIINMKAQHNQQDAGFLLDADLLAYFDLTHLQHTIWDHLSSSERVMVGLATLHLQNPEVLILDDPTSGLTGSECERILESISRLSSGRTTFFTTSRLSDVQAVATHTALLYAGSILSSGAVDTVFADPDSAIYRVGLSGDARIVYDHIQNLSWVRHIEAVQDDDKTEWTIAVAGDADAPNRLLRAIMADRSLKIQQFNLIRPRIDRFLDELKQTVTE